MQVCFFVAVGIFGIEMFTDRVRIRHLSVDIKTVTIAILMLLAIVTGVVRYNTGLPFTTAFFLLIAVAFLDMDFLLDVCGILYCSIIIVISLFEAGLQIFTKLSYADQFLAYMFADNVGIVLFLVAFL